MGRSWSQRGKGGQPGQVLGRGEGRNKARHVIVVNIVDEAESVFDENDRAQHVIVVIVEKEVDEARCAVVARRRMRSCT